VQDQQPGTAFYVGERISTLPLEDPLRIQGNVLGSVERIEIVNPGSAFEIGDYIYVPTTNEITGVGATAKVTSLIRTEVAEVIVINPGGGFYVDFPVSVDNTGTGGTGFSGRISKIKNGQTSYTRGPSLALLLQTNTGTSANIPINYAGGNWTAFLGTANNDPSGVLTNIRMTSFVSNVTSNTETVSFSIPGKGTTPIGEIEEIEVISPGSNYFKPPVLSFGEPLKPVYANGTQVPQNLLTGASAYAPATIEASFQSSKIATLQMVTGGSGYSERQTFTINSSNRTERTSSLSGINAELTIVPGALVRALPRSVGYRSQTSARQYLQDESLYQPFAYVLSTEQDITTYGDTVRRFVHPAGGKLVPDRMITAVVDAVPVVNSCTITRP
jgi:hypothetical protein